jgi:hypothetical protein
MRNAKPDGGMSARVSCHYDKAFEAEPLEHCVKGVLKG